MTTQPLPPPALVPAPVQRWLKGQGSSPPLLVSGVDTDHLEKFLQDLAQLAACEALPGTISEAGEGKEKACGRCKGCHLARLGTHPDIYVARPEGTTIKIATIRSLLHHVHLTPTSPRQLLAIQGAHHLSPPAATALLKSLEELPPNTRCVLLTPYPRRLLATIRSRCQHVRLDPSVYIAQPIQMNEGDAPASLWHALSTLGTQPLSPAALLSITKQLETQFRQQGATAPVRSAYQRLRDYYVVVTQQGNEKLARDVLLASLPAPSVLQRSRQNEKTTST